MDIATTATYADHITLALTYQESNVQGDESGLRLFHWTGSIWEDVTTSVDTVNNIVYGEVSSLSWFFIGGQWVWVETAPVPVSPNIYIGIVAVLAAGVLAYVVRRRFAGQT